MKKAMTIPMLKAEGITEVTRDNILGRGVTTIAVECGDSSVKIFTSDFKKYDYLISLESSTGIDLDLRNCIYYQSFCVFEMKKLTKVQRKNVLNDLELVDNVIYEYIFENVGRYNFLDFLPMFLNEKEEVLHSNTSSEVGRAVFEGLVALNNVADPYQDNLDIHPDQFMRDPDTGKLLLIDSYIPKEMFQKAIA
jgi:hypothetical protein